MSGGFGSRLSADRTAAAIRGGSLFTGRGVAVIVGRSWYWIWTGRGAELRSGNDAGRAGRGDSGTIVRPAPATDGGAVPSGAEFVTGTETGTGIGMGWGRMGAGC